MAVRYSLGLKPATGSETMLYELGTPNIPEALLNYFFGAAGNDTFAQIALGYRHMYGVDVPQSCQAGLLYYNPVAEQVVEAARYPGRLPQVLQVSPETCLRRRVLQHMSTLQMAGVSWLESVLCDGSISIAVQLLPAAWQN